jgi:hypothetical protein
VKPATARNLPGYLRKLPKLVERAVRRITSKVPKMVSLVTWRGRTKIWAETVIVVAPRRCSFFIVIILIVVAAAAIEIKFCDDW